ncbi:MAG: cardiolipin synthase [Phycisphaerales bacterium]|nr:cardiolipin synthase [Phycisphaerales bacterium]
MHMAAWLTTALIVLEAALQAGLSVRVLMRRLPTAATTSWIVLILFFPIMGVVSYLLVGESRVGRSRLARERRVQPTYDRYLAGLRAGTRHMPSDLSAMDMRIAREAEAANGLPLLGGNDVRLLDDAGEFFDECVRVIDGAQRTLRLEFYIWHSAGRVCEVSEALARAGRRGVDCRVLVDAVGSRPFLRGRQSRELRAAGVRVATALPPMIIKTPLIRRVDHRNHRKLVIADDCAAIVGSMNMADPACFKTKAGVGEWVDLMAVVRGPAVELCSLVAIRDWEMETGEDMGAERAALSRRCLSAAGGMGLQVVPSGPGLGAGSIHALVLSAVYAAERRLTITTPYFVPDQSIVTALQSAARRGVEVTLIVPARSDTVLTHHAGRAFFGDLLDAGVRIAEFRGGLLHTKSIVVDEEIALFGTVNIDPRSLWLNYELTAIVYDNGATRAIHARQLGYLRQSTMVDPDRWRERSIPKRLMANVAQLFAPLL